MTAANAAVEFRAIKQSASGNDVWVGYYDDLAVFATHAEPLNAQGYHLYSPIKLILRAPRGGALCLLVSYCTRCRSQPEESRFLSGGVNLAYLGIAGPGENGSSFLFLYLAKVCKVRLLYHPGKPSCHTLEPRAENRVFSHTFPNKLLHSLRGQGLVTGRTMGGQTISYQNASLTSPNRFILLSRIVTFRLNLLMALMNGEVRNL